MKWQSQLPTWHPLHSKEEPEEKMTPGAERAVMSLADRSVPQLVKVVGELVDAVKELAKPKQQAPIPDDRMAGALVLTKEQWIELIEAVVSKAEWVRKGAYPDAEDPQAWASSLDTLHQHLVTTLDAQGISL